MKRLVLLVVVALSGLCAGSAGAARPIVRHNVVLFVPDGLRALMVTPATAPAMAALRDGGVSFKNSHALFPTFTTPNASAMATGHYLGDTGDFSNTIYTGYAVATAGDSVTPFLESDPVLGDVDTHFAGDYLDEMTILRAAREQGLNTATIGKLGPALIFDHTNRAGAPTVVVDDSTGSPAGIPLTPDVLERLSAASLPAKAPSRGDNGAAGNATTPGTTAANVAQQQYFVDVATKVVLPMFKERGTPFVLVFWSRDPDGTQHNQGDSLNRLVPGINGPTSVAAVKNADDNLAQLRTALDALGLSQTTDIIVTADHGFATISKESTTSPSARQSYADVTAGLLPPGFLALDLGTALGLPVFDPDAKNAAVAAMHHPNRGNALIGESASDPDIVVAANGGSDLVYLPRGDRKMAARVVSALLQQDYVSGLFVDDGLGTYPGTLPLSAINLRGRAITPLPAIVVNFKTFATGCDQPLLCTVEVADTGLQQGQGMHGSFSRADTQNFMAAIGPDFKRGFVDEAPVSNADVGVTIARILGLRPPANGKLIGRVVTEAMTGGAMPRHAVRTMRSEASESGLRTVLDYQVVGATRYFDAAGFPGRTVGLRDAVERRAGASSLP
jgi:arylsulfatase A-like enzyme